MSSTELGKLTELREKTDRQLVALIQHELDAALRLAQDGVVGHARAERAYADAVVLLPVVKEQYREHLETRITELRAVLDKRVRSANA